MLPAIKRALLPEGEHVRTLPSGIGRGLRMPIDFSYQTRTYLGFYELELNRFLKSFASGSTTGALDVGGENGYDAMVLAKLTGQRVASFECDPEHVAKMRRTVALNPPLEPLVEVIEARVGDGADDLGIDEWVYGDGGFVPSVVKIDIEGAESGALRSAERLMAERRPNLIIETHSIEEEAACGRILVDHAYRPKVVHQRRVGPDHRPIPHNRWLVAQGAGV